MPVRQLQWENDTNIISESTGTVNFVDGGTNPVDYVYYRPGSGAAYLVWASSATLYLDSGLSNVSISQYVADRNALGITNIKLVLSSGVVGRLNFDATDRGVGFNANTQLEFYNYGEIQGFAGTYGVSAGPAVSLYRPVKFLNYGNVRGGGGYGGRGGDGADSGGKYYTWTTYTSTQKYIGVEDPYNYTFWRTSYTRSGAWINGLRIYDEPWPLFTGPMPLDGSYPQYWRGDYVGNYNGYNYYKMLTKTKSTASNTISGKSGTSGSNGSSGIGFGQAIGTVSNTTGISRNSSTASGSTVYGYYNGQGGKGGTGGSWGAAGNYGNAGGYAQTSTGTNGTSGRSAYINNGRSSGGNSILKWNTYATSGSILGSTNGART